VKILLNVFALFASKPKTNIKNGLMSSYDHLTKEQLIALLQRREREASYGLVWERDEIEPDKHVNDDFVALDLDRSLSCGAGPWENLIIEGDNFDALRYLRMTHAGKVKCIYIDPPYNTGNRDFVIGIKDRKVGNGIALVEMKGPHLQLYERAKASARHKVYGLAVMVGYDKEKKDFVMFREEADQLFENGRFETSRMRWDG
jgi:adenine specific DNA methylase Mod